MRRSKIKAGIIQALRAGPSSTGASEPQLIGKAMQKEGTGVQAQQQGERAESQHLARARGQQEDKVELRSYSITDGEVHEGRRSNCNAEPGSSAAIWRGGAKGRVCAAVQLFKTRCFLKR